MGTGTFLKQHDPTIQVIAVEPPLGSASRVSATSATGTSRRCFENWNGYELLDRKRVVRPRESIEWTRRLVNECGIFAGISAGAAMAGAAKGCVADCVRDDRVHRLRRRLEVSVDRCVHR